MVRHESEFTSSDLKELRRIFGKSLDAALPGLKMAAAFYKGARERQVSSNVRTELLRLKAVLEKLKRTATALSPDAMLILERTFDYEAAVSHSSRPDGRGALAHATRASARARELVQNAQQGPRNSPGHLLASGVAGALSAARLPLSKGRDALLADVLRAVWQAVEPDRPDRVPEEMFPYIRAAANIGTRQDPELRAPKGRPTRRKK